MNRVMFLCAFLVVTLVSVFSHESSFTGIAKLMANQSVTARDSIENLVLVNSAWRSLRRAYGRRALAYSNIVVPISHRYGIDWRLVTAVIAAESTFEPCTTSPNGAVGLMQVMPATALLYHVETEDLCDPHQNVRAGVLHLRKLTRRFKGDLNLTVAAYNAGEGAVEKYGGIPPYRETRAFVARVLNYHESLRYTLLTAQGGFYIRRVRASR